MEENKDIENIDELSRSVIGSHDMNPPDGAWNSLDVELTKKQAIIYKRRADRFKALSIGLALLLVSFVTFYYFTLSPNANQSGEIAYKTLPDNYQNSSGIVHSDSSEVNFSGNLSSGKNISVPQNVGPVNTPDVLNQEEKKNESPSTHGHAVTKKEEVHSMSSQSRKTTEQKENELAFQIEKAPSAINERVNISGDAPISANKKSDASIPGDVHNEIRVNDSQKKDLQETESSEELSSISDNSEKPNADTIKPEESTAGKHDPIGNNRTNDSILSERSRIISRLSVAFFYAPNYVRNHLVDNVPDDDENVSDYYKREKSEYSYSTGVSLRYDLSNSLSVSTGCAFSTAEYSMTYSIIYVKYGWDNQLHIQYPTSSGIVEVPNTGINSWHEGDSLNVIVNCTQLVKFINAPLAVRYEIKKNKFTWYGDAGLVANFITQELVKLSFGTVNKTIFNNVDGLKKMNFGFLVGAGSQFNFSNSLGIFVEPIFKGSITSITHQTPMDSYPYSLGLNIGASLHF